MSCLSFLTSFNAPYITFPSTHVTNIDRHRITITAIDPVTGEDAAFANNYSSSA